MMSLVFGRPEYMVMEGWTRSFCFKEEDGVDEACEAGRLVVCGSGIFDDDDAQQQHGAMLSGEAVSSISVLQQHVPSGPQDCCIWSDLTVVSSRMLSFSVTFSCIGGAVRPLYWTAPCSISFLSATLWLGAVMVDRSDLCSSVNDSSQVTYTVSSSLMSRSVSCRS